VTERRSRSGGRGGGRRAAEAATLTPSDDDVDCNETLSVVSNCSDMQTVAQLTDGKHSTRLDLDQHRMCISCNDN